MHSSAQLKTFVMCLYLTGFIVQLHYTTNWSSSSATAAGCLETDSWI